MNTTDRFITLTEFSRLISRKKTWIYNQLKAESCPLPQPIKIAGGRHSVWSAREIYEWMEEQRQHAPRGIASITTVEATAARGAARKGGAK